MTNLPASPDTIDEILEKLVKDVQPVIYLNNLPPPHVKPALVEEAKAKLESLLVEARIDELKILISGMNAGEEFMSEPSQENKAWNSVILNTIRSLEAEHLKLKEQQ